jgi:hypothetical protein
MQEGPVCPNFATHISIELKECLHPSRPDSKNAMIEGRVGLFFNIKKESMV